MARLRKPSPNEPTIPMPPKESNATRTYPRRTARSLRYTEISSDDDDDENSVLVPKTSRRDLRNPATKVADASSLGLTPRKQRVLRPVESNSRLLRKLSDESLASPEKRQRERRVRSGTTDTDVDKKTRLMYARTLAKSVSKKQASRMNISVIAQDDRPEGIVLPSRTKRTSSEEGVDDQAQDEVEASTISGDDNVSVDKSPISTEQSSGEDEDDAPIIPTRQRQRRPQTRCVNSDSDSDEKGHEEEVYTSPLDQNADHPSCGSGKEVNSANGSGPGSLELPRSKGHSTINKWAKEVIDLTDSPKPPSSIDTPTVTEPSRTRTASFASSRPSTSSSSDVFAILTYSPTPTKFRSPCKVPLVSRPITPPLVPTSPSKLVSPSKKKPVIPKAPNLRPSLDAFWNPEVVNEWNEKHSPIKPLVSPKKQKWREDVVKMMEGITLEDDSSSDDNLPSPSTSPRKKKNSNVGQLRNPTKKLAVSTEPSVKEIRAQRKDFAAKKHAIAETFLSELDETISQGRIGKLSHQTGGIKIVWSKTLKTTAGRANWRREQLRLRTGPLPTDFKVEIRHHCSIELAEKVIDDEERLYNVLAHEFCHLTTFMISEERNNPHGAEFKSWGRKATEAFASRGVEVTTKHSYQIEYKYVWECVICGYEHKRHSKSIDPARHTCGRCRGTLAQTKPTPRGVGTGVAGKDGKREKTEYQIFVKANFSQVKKRLQEEGQDAKMGKVMEAVAKEYREMKASKEKSTGGLEDALEDLKI